MGLSALAGRLLAKWEESRMIAVQVIRYPGQGRLAQLSPYLWLVLSIEDEVAPPVQAATGLYCPRCRQPVTTHPLTNLPEWCALRCPCLTLVYASHTAAELAQLWPGFIRAKREIESQLVPVTNN